MTHVSWYAGIPDGCVFCFENKCSFNVSIKEEEKRKIMNNVIKSIKNKVSNVTSDIRFKSMKQKAASAALGTVAMMSMYTNLVYADGDTSAITKPLTSLKTLVVAIIGAVGVIILAKNVMEFAQAYQQQDSSTMNSALKGIVAGIMMAGISTVLSFLGY